MSLVCQPCDPAGRWAFLGDSTGRGCRHKGLQAVLAPVEHGQEFPDRLGPAPCFSRVVFLYAEQHVCNNPCGSHHILHLKHHLEQLSSSVSRYSLLGLLSKEIQHRQHGQEQLSHGRFTSLKSSISPDVATAQVITDGSITPRSAVLLARPPIHCPLPRPALHLQWHFWWAGVQFQVSDAPPRFIICALFPVWGEMRGFCRMVFDQP